MTPPLASRPLLVALAGNPNTGKTSIFNRLSGARAKVANYPGVTVERRQGRLTLPSGAKVALVDVPGCYSLTARSAEEEVAHAALTGGYDDPPADVVVIVADASNLPRNLYFVLQVLELGRPTVVALNMMDVARDHGLAIDVARLERELGVPVIPVVATTGEGLPSLVMAIESLGRATPPVPRTPPLLTSDRAVLDTVAEALRTANRPATAGECLWLLTSEPTHITSLPDTARDAIARVRTQLDAEAEQVGTSRLPFNRRVIVARYAEVDRLVAEAVSRTGPAAPDWTTRIDRVLTHPRWGLALFVLAMSVVFQAIFTWAEPLMGLVERGSQATAAAIGTALPDGVLKELLVQGLLAGVGNVLVFLPQILLLFLAITLLEDTGYMARAAVLLDRVMRRVGLHGRAFVPLLSSFACASPGIMAARTIEAPRDRLVTTLVAPFMSCSARLPVYTMVIGAVFASAPPVLGVLSVGGLVVTAMYFLGIAAAFGTAWLLKRTVLQAPTPPLLVELPTYKLPAPRSVLIALWSRAKVFVTQTGRTIVTLSVILWALMAYPRVEPPAAADAHEAARYQLEHSAAGTLGHAVEPLIAPLGFDWRIGIGLIGSFAAREVLVSTLGQVYGVGSEIDAESVVLREALLRDIHPETGRPRFSPLVGLALMVFFVLAMQCLATVAIVRRETGTWKWPLVMIVYMNGLAWVAALVTYQGGRLLGFA